MLFTSESVTEGHPDKICDQISDAILDACLKKDPHSRVAVEAMVKNNKVFIVGEVTTKSLPDFEKITRKVIKDIGYTDKELGFDYKGAKVNIAISKQSQDIAQGVNLENKKIGAGDQGMMFGFATRESKNLMPLPITLAHALTKKLSEVRKNKKLKFLRPDGKSQVTIEYQNGKPARVKTVLVSTQHDPDVDNSTLKGTIQEEIINPVLKSFNLLKTNPHPAEILVNPTGRFVIGGPVGDSGLTGRKIMVDTYGGFARHGGGAFSGKDPTKVDRSAAYFARYVAKSLVKKGLAGRAEIQVAYAIGVAEPVSIMVETFKTERVSAKEIEKFIKKFDFTPSGIIAKLDLLQPIYQQTACYGHFGRDEFPWEKVDDL